MWVTEMLKSRLEGRIALTGVSEWCTFLSPYLLHPQISHLYVVLYTCIILILWHLMTVFVQSYTSYRRVSCPLVMQAALLTAEVIMLNVSFYTLF